jgi:hypothetical protein
LAGTRAGIKGLSIQYQVGGFRRFKWHVLRNPDNTGKQTLLGMAVEAFGISPLYFIQGSVNVDLDERSAQYSFGSFPGFAKRRDYRHQDEVIIWQILEAKVREKAIVFPDISGSKPQMLMKGLPNNIAVKNQYPISVTDQDLLG